MTEETEQPAPVEPEPAESATEGGTPAEADEAEEASPESSEG